ncbi:diguanylate cyclase [Mycobacterium sp. CBMA271]|uniref:GGDEF domain-containing protein n=1 Tax=unclassified Mycobacteroides TaxID=2618759 RepID=UPI0012DC4B40|nr:diguanylate cyclase [Mycobacteroides sp. CBMA 271]
MRDQPHWVDRLKELNDTHRHEAGDETLKAVTQNLVSSTRAGDIAARTSTSNPFGGPRIRRCTSQKAPDSRACMSPAAWP